jgi:cell division transport system permease protein
MNLEVSTKPRSEEPGSRVARRPGRRLRVLGAILGDAVGAMRRNGLMAAAATTTIAIALAVAGGGFLVSANLGHLASVLEAQVEVVGFFKRDLGVGPQRRALTAVQALPAVRSAAIVGRAEALRRLQRTYSSVSSIRGVLPSNPLPDSIEVRVTDAREVREVAAALRQVDGIDDVVFGAPVVDRLVALTRAVRIAGAAIAGLLVGAALLIIMNTIRLTIAARRQEIEIMNLVGAAPGFIRAPFILEGALQGITAALMATGVIAAGYVLLATQASTSLPFLPLLPPAGVLPQAAVVMWVLGIAVGIGGSEMSVRRYLGG